MLANLWCWLLAMLARKRRETAWKGGKPLVQGREALIVQMPLVLAFSSDHGTDGWGKAAIIQKIHEWVSYNAETGKADHFREGRWWTYNGYRDWVSSHFPGVSFKTVERWVGDLEDAGVLISKQMNKHRGDCRKWYTLDYEKLAAKVTGVSIHAPDAPSKQGGTRVGTSSSEGRYKFVRGLVEVLPRVGTTSTYIKEESQPFKQQNKKPKLTNARDAATVDKSSGLRLAKVEIPEAATRIGMDELVASGLVEQFGAALVTVWSTESERERIPTQMRAGWAVKRIRTGMPPTSPLTPPSSSVKSMEFDYQPMVETREVKPDVEAGINAAAVKVWRGAWAQLRLQLGAMGFDPYLKESRLLAVEGECYVIEVRNSLARDMCQHRLYRNIRKVMSDSAYAGGMNGETLSLRFEAAAAGTNGRAEFLARLGA